jgi:anhydro-N-acetylmuramic acid kinase
MNNWTEKSIIMAVGTMSGTSCDGVDVALIKTDGESHLECLDSHFVAYPKPLAHRILSAMNSDSNIEILRLETEITQYHADAVNALLQKCSLKPDSIDIIGFHGQTILHKPSESITQQIGNPHLLAELTKISVVSDFRRRDIAAGGQGAPLTPLFHQALARHFQLTKAIFLNIGGISNITYINDDKISAFDIGPGNSLIDDLLRTRIGIEYDKDGIISADGISDSKTVQAIMADPFFAKNYPKSLDHCTCIKTSHHSYMG